MDNKDKQNLTPYAVDMTVLAYEYTNKRMYILCILLIALLVITNAAWVYRESQFEDVVTTVTQEVDAQADGDSNLNLNTVGGDYYGGESESEADYND